MKVKFFNLIVVFLFISTVFFNCRILRKDNSLSKQDFIENALIYYGEEIYDREACSKCHTQNIEKANDKLISLDGLGMKYQSESILLFLLDPKGVKPGLINHSYKYLFEKKMEYENLKNIAKKRHFNTKIEYDQVWNHLVLQSDSFSQEMQLQNQPFLDIKNRSEGIALVAYLKNIQSSKAKRKLDSLDNKKWMDLAISFENNVSTNETNIKNGKILFLTHCAMCHNNDGTGMIGANLTDKSWIHGGKAQDVAKSIIFGIPDKGMIPFKNKISPDEVGDILAFLNSINELEH